MNVVTPKLLPSQYGAANDLKTAVQQALDYQKLHPGSAGDTAISAYFSAVANGATEAASVDDADALTVKTSDGTVSSAAAAVVADNVVTQVTLANTSYLVKNGDVLNAVGGGTITVAVVAGVPTFTYATP